MNNIITQEEKNKIDALCKQYKIRNYTINSDGSIDVTGSVNLSGGDFTSIPLKFNKVKGDFDCANNNLTSLEGCPKVVTGYFFCQNNKLTSLNYCPKKVGIIFDFNNNSLPNEYHDGFMTLGISPDSDEDDVLTTKHKLFLKYQPYYDIWTPEFNLKGMNDLLADIEEGLA
jgi:hypothetical protein